MNAIDVRGLTKIYRQRQRKSGIVAAVKSLFKEDYTYKTAVDDISFSIEEGDIVGLLGPNGAGKTTVLKVLSGILYPTKGNIEVTGHIPYLKEVEFKKKISLVVGQKNQLIWDLPAIDTLLWLKEIYDINKSTFNDTVKKLTSIFEAEELLNLQVRRMSLGQRMKMELIASMIHNPKVIFLDEPTIGLDIVGQNNLRDFIKEYNRQTGATVVLTSHNLNDVDALCEKIILINEGKVTYDNTLDKLIESYCGYKIFTLTGIQECIIESDLPKGVQIVSNNNGKTVLNVDLNISQDVIRYIWANFTFNDISVEDVGIDKIIEKAFLDKGELF